MQHLPPWTTIPRGVVPLNLALAMSLAGCGNHGHDNAARIVATTRVCQTVEARPGMFVHVSRFNTPQFWSHTPHVLAICNERGGCNAKAWFEGPYAPNVRLGPEGGLRIEIAAIRHRVFPDHALTPRVDVQFTNTVGANTLQIEKRFKPLDCSDEIVRAARRKIHNGAR